MKDASCVSIGRIVYKCSIQNISQRSLYRAIRAFDWVPHILDAIIYHIALRSMIFLPFWKCND